MDILVIGGNRFFGKKLVRKLISANHSVTILNRQNFDDGFGTQVQRIKCDRKDSSAMRAALSGKRWDLVYDQVCYDASEARAACEIFKGQVSHYIFTSTQSVYEQGRYLKEDAFDPTLYKFTEDLEFAPGVSSKANYAEAKRQCEAVFFAQHIFPVTAVRFTFVVGEDDYTGRLKWHVDRVKAGKPIYYPNIEAKVPMIHSDDAAEVLFSLGLIREAGPFNASSPEPVALRDLLAQIEQVAGNKATVTQDKTEENHSPYGVEADWYMSIDKLKSFAVTPRPVDVWLPQLLKLLSNT